MAGVGEVGVDGKGGEGAFHAGGREDWSRVVGGIERATEELTIGLGGVFKRGDARWPLTLPTPSIHTPPLPSMRN
eukprot:1191099-Prorocentrum_minimum.AAC.13